MEKIFTLAAIGSMIFMSACNFSATETTVNEDSLRQDSIRKADSVRNLLDTTSVNLGDSLNASIDSAKAKLKTGVQDIKDGAQQLGKVIGDKAKQGADAVKEGAQKVGDAVKEGAETTRDALKKNN